MSIIVYSIFMPYHKRADQLQSTLKSFLLLYGDRKDFEIIIAEDWKNNEHQPEHRKLMDIVSLYEKFFPITYFIADSQNGCNSASMYNECAEVAQGQYFIITNPEGMHRNNILAGLDEEFGKDPSVYVICSSLSVRRSRLSLEEAQTIKGVWYQHSVHRNIQCHFCSCISAERYKEIGGFDEEYSKGFAFEDDDFRNKIISNRIPIVYRDDLVSLHLHHDKSKPKFYVDLHRINKQYYETKWGKDAFKAEDIKLRIQEEG